MTKTPTAQDTGFGLPAKAGSIVKGTSHAGVPVGAQTGEGKAPRTPMEHVYGKTRVKIFQEWDGRWFLCNAEGDMTVAAIRGAGYMTRQAAVKEAKYWGWIIVK